MVIVVLYYLFNGGMMEDRPLYDKSVRPDITILKSTLNKTFRYYDELINSTNEFKHEWNYSKISGWMLKISDRKKALLYVIPLTGSFKISLTLRENEKEILLNEQEFADLHDQIKNAKKFIEGFALQFMITDKESYAKGIKLIKKLIGLRR